MSRKLLLVEDNHALREQMKWALADQFEVLEADSSQSCLALFQTHAPALVCLDMGLDNEPTRGLALIDDLLTQNRNCKIIVITANTISTLGSDAIAKGAFDFLQKPIDIENLKVLLARAKRLLDLEKPQQDINADSMSMETAPDFEMIGKCSAMQRIFQIIKKLALTEVNALITGDSGTGKELCARAIHFHSPRSAHPFVPINCGAIPESLLESELFGYAKGAFTGAVGEKIGLIESANGGTLFLDEIGDMPKHLQVKLLRFLEDQTFQRVGDPQMRKANVRLVAATNKKGLDKEDNEAMRTDLYYRLSEFEIYLPPLHEREEDVLLLAQELIKRNQKKFSMPKLKLSNRAEKVLLQYSWPGNVRELENKLSRASITCINQVIEPEDLQLSPTEFDNMLLKDARDMFEKNFITDALKKANFVIAKAAKNIGVSRPTLYDLMKKHNIAISYDGKIEDR